MAIGELLKPGALISEPATQRLPHDRSVIKNFISKMARARLFALEERQVSRTNADCTLVSHIQNR
jgi:hypothetical protein